MPDHMSMPDRTASTLEDTFRREWPRLVAAAARIVGDLARAEEIAQDVMVIALDRWPFSGVPDRPGAWLLTAARNRARNVVRDEARALGRDRLAAVSEVAPSEDVDGGGPIGDDLLGLVFACCHPLLNRDAQVALTLRLVGGLSTPEIARAFLSPRRRSPSGRSGPNASLPRPRSVWVSRPARTGGSGCRPSWLSCA
jgi:predicted RNA polymerase sigma factor